MNRHHLAFTVYDGDWKAGGPINTSATDPSVILTCEDALYTRQIPAYFDALEAPAMYAVGDNEWTDCDRSATGVSSSAVFNSLNRLSLIRRLYFNDNPFSFGKRKLRQEVQTDTCFGWKGTNPNDVTPGYLSGAGYINETCSENRRWHYGGVTYVTINQVGSCNNRCKQFPDDKEWGVRNDANIKWVQDTFALAKAKDSAAIMIISQADPGWNLATLPGFDSRRDPLTLVLQGSDPDGFFKFMVTLRNETTSFKKPVVFVHGDSHYFIVDKPLLAWGGERLVNFTRVMTFGDNQDFGNNDVNWVKVTVDPRSQHVFSFTPMVVAKNTPSQAAP